ncbi:hypothetical protein GXW83_16515 [Streptacidiphilus sp. PB12-B1b]|uniref:hypothetical protein n=1 Tax=Streptacidiphilus sp. PB12-B1b TaxID=2705012 RepID=UPI0015FBF7C8|nr:hypothetical protein [Streptacidiphilus sp. PB12-B1b]QMU77071.1 hypothetical protein GXW83_16515 [Streptacidiphilus sp. PB12-B1b]
MTPAAGAGPGQQAAEAPATTETTGTTRATEAAEAAESVEPDDHLRHIICMTCFPAFDGARQAPHDAVCVCGRRIRKGDRRNPADTAQCILCNELWRHHKATAHP